jgi:hypothetical protein
VIGYMTNYKLHSIDKTAKLSSVLSTLRIWKKTVVACYKVLPRHSFKITRINHEETQPGCVRFEVLTEVKMTMLFFWAVTPCRSGGRYQRFEEKY